MATSKTDGNVNFMGGMDTSRPPSYLSPNKYSIGINTWIANSPEGVKNRPGLRELKLQFNTTKEEEIYHTGNIQGEGWYFNGTKNIILRSIDGYIFQFEFITYDTLFGVIINSGFRNNPNNKEVWITKVPKGAVISDGESACISTSAGETRRTNPKNKEIGSGKMGVYLQNRLFIVDSGGERIIASTFQQPLSISEALANNLYGFIAPDDSKVVTAIGKERILIAAALTGNLSFSTTNNVYRIDVRGGMADWGRLQGFNVGAISDSVPGIGACSSQSYVPVNSNLYFRNETLGLMSIKQSQYQFESQDAYSSHSLEASLFLDNDTDILLNKCYTRLYRDKLLTTIGPQLRNGFTYWSGLITYSPDIFFSQNQVLNRTWDGVITGIRPWCMTLIDSPGHNQLIIDSYDHDGVNRMYMLDDSLNHDITSKGIRQIESKIFTKGYTFNAPEYPKNPLAAYYSLANIEEKTTVKIETRNGEEGDFQDLWCIEHKNRHVTGLDSRQVVKVNNDPPDAHGVKNFIVKQDLFKITGSFGLRRWIRDANIEPSQTNSFKEPDSKNLKTVTESIYEYKLHE